jgi:hypothetical protein
VARPESSRKPGSSTMLLSTWILELVAGGWLDGRGDRHLGAKTSKSIRDLSLFAKRISAKWMMGFGVLILGLSLLAFHRPAPQAQSATVAATANFPNDDPGSPPDVKRQSGYPDAVQMAGKELSPTNAAVSTLDIRIDHPFAAARVSAWVDQELAIARADQWASLSRPAAVVLRVPSHACGRQYGIRSWKRQT